MLVLISTRRLLLQNQYRVELEESKEEKQEFSGVNEEPTTSTAKVTEREVAGKYRGNPWRASNLKKAPVLQPTFDLKYRGNSITAQKPHTRATP